MDESPQAPWKRVGPVVLTTLVPIVAAVTFVAVAMLAKKSPDYASQPSMAAFDACMTANNLQRQGFTSEFDRTVWSQEVMKICGDELPPPDPAIEAAREASRDAYEKCLKGFGVSMSRGFGRFRRGPSSEARNAFAVCRTLLSGADEGGGQPKTVPKKQPAGPIA